MGYAALSTIEENVISRPLTFSPRSDIHGGNVREDDAVLCGRYQCGGRVHGGNVNHVQTQRTGPKLCAFSVWTQFTVSTSKRSELPRGMPLATRMFASSEHAWDPMASSRVDFCRKNAHRTPTKRSPHLSALRTRALHPSTPSARPSSLCDVISEVTEFMVSTCYRTCAPSARPSSFGQNSP
jgi:hypothetical protein